MPAYRCKIVQRNGENIERVIQSDSVAALKAEVQADGGFLVKYQRTGGNGSTLSFSTKSRKIKPKEIYSFNQEFLTLIKAGLPVVSILTGIIEKLKPGYLLEVLTAIRDDIKEGSSLSDAFGKYEDTFTPLYIAMLRAGEAGGDVPEAVSAYLKHFEREQNIRHKIKAASTYPVILVICSVAVVFFLLTYIVPSITGSLIESDEGLPFLTSVLLSFSGFVKSYAILIIAMIMACASGVVIYLKKSDKGRLLFDRYVLKFPFFGNLLIIYTVGLFSSSLSAILKGGIPLDRSLHVAKGLIKNKYMQKTLDHVIGSIQKGNTFADSLQEAGIFPDMAIRMITAGEASGNLEEVLMEAAKFYERDVESRLTVITSAIEPALMVIMGIVIGFILLAVYMPIFQMAQTIGY
ncbi:MAG: type II secretion system F family protein [Desulfobacter sp.]|nr:MAG: type II secretion system F family protein [Desulfobacter sp.]